MANINQMELQNLRHFIGTATTFEKKLAQYAEDAEDEQIKQMFSEGSTNAKSNKKALMSFLEN